MIDPVRDPQTPDGMYYETRAKLETHEKVCAERYGNLWNSVNRIENNMTALSNRMFGLLITVCGATIVGLGMMALQYLTKGH